jgi:hypothetical protein
MAQPVVTTVVCNFPQTTVPAFGGFNQDTFCPTGHFATGGGYQVTSKATGELLGISVSENKPFGGPTNPTGWQVIGSNTTGIVGQIQVCVICK